MKRAIVLMLLIASSLVFLHCGGGGGGGGKTNNSSNTDPPPEINPPQLTNSAVFVASDRSPLHQIGIVFKNISLVNTTSGAACNLRTEQTLIDAEALSAELQLLNFANCPLDAYDSIQLVVSDKIRLSMDSSTQMCTLDSFRLGESETAIPFTCDVSAGTCEARVPTAAELSVNGQNNQTLSFNMKTTDLKDFPLTNCRTTLGVSALNAADIQNRFNDGFDYAVTGGVFSVDTAHNTFILSAAGRLFTTQYGGLNQANPDRLITFAQNNALRVKVLSSYMDLSTTVLPAWKVFLKVEGTITKVDTSTFDLAITNDSRVVTIDYRNAEVSGGALAIGQPTHVKVTGVTSRNIFLAEFIDIGEIGMEN